MRTASCRSRRASSPVRPGPPLHRPSGSLIASGVATGPARSPGQHFALVTGEEGGDGNLVFPGPARLRHGGMFARRSPCVHRGGAGAARSRREGRRDVARRSPCVRRGAPASHVKARGRMVLPGSLEASREPPVMGRHHPRRHQGRQLLRDEPVGEVRRSVVAGAATAPMCVDVALGASVIVQEHDDGTG